MRLPINIVQDRNGLFCPRSYFMNTKYIVTIKIEKKAVR